MSVNLTAPPKRRVFEEIATFLESEIISGRLKPGSRLKPERELADDLKVSRSSLREALKALEMLGVVEIKHGLGVYVCAPQARVISGYLGTLISMQPSATDDILEARIALECHAARLACQFASRADLQQMKMALDRLAAAADNCDATESAEADYEFHTAIVESTKSVSIRFIYQAISTSLRSSHRLRWVDISRSVDYQFRLEVHRRIYLSIKSRTEEAAYSEMYRHFLEIYAGA